MVCVFCNSHTNPADPINPCFQRLTYEEKMARRLLGADNAATVLNTQDTEEEPVTQVRWPLVDPHTWRGRITHIRTPWHHTGMETFKRPVCTSSVFNINPTVACLFFCFVLWCCAGVIPSEWLLDFLHILLNQNGPLIPNPCKHCLRSSYESRI